MGNLCSTPTTSLTQAQISQLNPTQREKKIFNILKKSNISQSDISELRELVGNFVKLSLHGCEIGEAGAIALGEVLSLSRISILELENINDASVQALAKVLETNKTLVILELNKKSQIGSEGMMAIVDALEKNPNSTIKSLDLGKNAALSDEVQARLAVCSLFRGIKISGLSEEMNFVISSINSISAKQGKTIELNTAGLEDKSRNAAIKKLPRDQLILMVGENIIPESFTQALGNLKNSLATLNVALYGPVVPAYESIMNVIDTKIKAEQAQQEERPSSVVHNSSVAYRLYEGYLKKGEEEPFRAYWLRD